MPILCSKIYNYHIHNFIRYYWNETITIMYCVVGPMKALDLKLEDDQPDFAEPVGNYTIPAGRDVQLSCKINNLGTNKVSREC